MTLAEQYLLTGLGMTMQVILPLIVFLTRITLQLNLLVLRTLR